MTVRTPFCAVRHGCNVPITMRANDCRILYRLASCKRSATTFSDFVDCSLAMTVRRADERRFLSDEK